MQQFANQNRVFCNDNGLLTNTAFLISEDYDGYLENIVFIEMKRRGLETYFHHGKKECDFVVKEGQNICQAIEVCSTMQDESTKKRELDGLLEALEAYGLHEGTILTEDEEFELVTESRRITVLPVWKWIF
jgi:predicted AAA+ superfamily ATPase